MSMFEKNMHFLVLSFALVACGDDDPQAHEEEDPAEHACEHTGEAGTSIVASADPADAPELALGDEPYTVSLVPGSVGYVRLEAPAEALLFVGTADVVTGLTLDGEEVSLPASAPNEFCEDDVPEHFDLDLDEAGSYVLKLGPAGVGDVWMMYTAAAGHAH